LWVCGRKDAGAFSIWHWIIVLPIYFLPAIIAAVRHHPQSVVIFMLNLLVGWTFLGWVAAIVWASIRTTPRDPIANRS